MKTIYFKFFATFLVAFVMSAGLIAQTTGDYRSKQSGGWYGNAVGTAIIESGVITGINLTSGGQGYTVAPAITIQNGGGTTTATSTITDGVVTGYAITNGGVGCSVASTAVIFASPTAVADQAANWETYNGTEWVQATALPTKSNNVTIRSGHTITISSGGDANCKNLTIEEGATLNSPNYAGNYVTTLGLWGNVVNDGVLGNTSSSRSVGDGIRAYQNATGTTTFSGTGITNIGSFQVGGNITSSQSIVISQSMELRRTNTGNGGTINLGIQAGTMGTAAKTLTINPGCTVKITSGGLHAGQNAATTSVTGTSGDLSYNIEGTLDCSLGQFNLYNTTNTGSSSQALAVNVKNGGKLVLGTRIQLYTALSGQTCTITPETGSTVEFGGTAAPAFSLTTGSGTAPTFPTSFTNLTNNNSVAAGITLPNATTVNGKLSLIQGKLNTTNGLILGNAASIVRTGGTLSGAPTFGTAADLKYGLTVTQTGTTAYATQSGTTTYTTQLGTTSTTTQSGTFTTTTSTGSTTSASKAVTLTASNSAITVGAYVTGTGIAAGTTVTAVSGTSVTLSANATATGSNITLTFGTPSVVLSAENAAIEVGMYVSGTGIATGTTVSTISGTALTLSQNVTAAGTGVTLTFGSKIVTLDAENSAIVPGMLVTGTGITTSTTVAAISGTNLTLSLGVNAAGTNTLTFKSQNVTLDAPNANIVPGMTVSGTSITTGTTVAAISGTTLTLSQPVTAAGTNELTFTSPNVTLSASNSDIYIDQLVTGTGIPASTTVSSIVGTVLTLSNSATAAGTNTLTFSKNAAQTASFEMPASTTVLNNLTIDNSSGVTLASSPTVNGSLTLTSGTLATGANTLTLKGATSGSGLINTGTTGTLTFAGTTEQTLASSNLTSGTVNNLVVNAGSKLNTTGTITATNLTVNSDATGTGTIVDGGTLTASNANVNQYLTYRTWYMSSPVASATPTAGIDRVKYYDEATNLWSTLYNSALTSGQTAQAYGANSFGEAKGYLVVPTNPLVSPITFSGVLNTGAKSVSLTTSGSTAKAGFNLVGNPYPSYIKWSDIYAANSTKVASSMYYRTKVGSEYIFWTVTNGAVASPAAATDEIPPMQAFWVLATTADNLNFTNSMRDHAPASNYMLKAPAAKNTDLQIVRLQVNNGINTDEAVIYFNTNASNGLDTYDAQKMSNENANIAEIYTMLGDKQIVINGMNAIPLDQAISLGFVAGNASSFSIKANEISNLPSDVKVVLKDNVSMAETDLTDGVSAYQFSSTESSAGRFSVIFRTAGTATALENAVDNSLFVYGNAHRQIVLNCNNDLNLGSVVSVYNAVGQKLISEKIATNQMIVANDLTPGMYVVKVNNITKKVTIK